MELPSGPVQEYIRLAGVAAIYVASTSSGVCRVGVSRDLKRTQTMLRKQGFHLTCAAAFWVNDTKTAMRLAGKVNRNIRRAGGALTVNEATARIEATAVELKVHLTEHTAVMQRASAAMLHLRTTLEQARKTGGLRWFNQAFADFRSRAKACGHPPLSYGQAHARLRRVLVQRVLTGERSGLGAEILPLVFPIAETHQRDP